MVLAYYIFVYYILYTIYLFTVSSVNYLCHVNHYVPYEGW